MICRDLIGQGFGVFLLTFRVNSVFLAWFDWSRVVVFIFFFFFQMDGVVVSRDFMGQKGGLCFKLFCMDRWAWCFVVI